MEDKLNLTTDEIEATLRKRAEADYRMPLFITACTVCCGVLLAIVIILLNMGVANQRDGVTFWAGAFVATFALTWLYHAHDKARYVNESVYKAKERLGLNPPA